MVQRRSLPVQTATGRGARPGSLAHAARATAIPLIVSAVIGLGAGCASTRKSVEAGGAKTRSLLSDIEPTGGLREIQERRALWTDIRGQVTAIDIVNLNQAVGQLNALVSRLTERVDALPPEDVARWWDDVAASAASIRSQLDQLQLQPAVESITKLADTADAKVGTIDVDRFNATLEELTAAAADVRHAVGQLHRDVTPAVEQTQNVARSADEAIRQLPMGQLRESVAQVPGITNNADATLGTIRLTFRIAAGAVAVFGLCGIAWLVRLVRQ